MKINGNVYRTTHKIKTGIILIICGLFFGAMGFIMIASGNKAAEKGELVTATITDIKSQWVADDREYTVIVEFEYQGETHQAVADYYSNSMNEGDTLEGYYDGSDRFTVKSAGKSAMLFIVAGLGAILFISGIVSIVKCVSINSIMRKQDEQFEGNENAYDVNEDAKGEFKKYSVVIQPSFTTAELSIINEEGNPVYKSHYLKRGPFSGQVQFSNLISNKEEVHRIGNVVRTQSTSGALSTTDATFRIDGQDVFNYIHRLGIRIETDVLGGNILPVYTIKYQGRYYGTLKLSPNQVGSGTKNLLDSIQRAANTFHIYELEARDEDLDIVFLCVYAVIVTGKVLID